MTPLVGSVLTIKGVKYRLKQIRQMAATANTIEIKLGEAVFPSEDTALEMQVELHDGEESRATDTNKNLIIAYSFEGKYHFLQGASRAYTAMQEAHIVRAKLISKPMLKRALIVEPVATPVTSTEPVRYQRPPMSERPRTPYPKRDY